MGRANLIGLAGFLLVILTGILLGVGGYTFYYAEGFSYFSDDPKACVNCHIMREQYDSWVKAPHHAAATCNDCHVSHHPIGKWLVKASNGYHHSVAFTFENFHEPIRIRPSNAAVLEANCLRCHGEFVEQITAHGGLNKFESDLFGCVKCHKATGHGPAR